MPKKVTTPFSLNTFLIIILVAVIAIVIWCLTIKIKSPDNNVQFPVTHLERKTEQFESGEWVDDHNQNMIIRRLCPKYGQELNSPEIHLDLNIKMKHKVNQAISIIDAQTKCNEYDNCEGFAATRISHSKNTALVTFFDSSASFKVSNGDPTLCMVQRKIDENI